MRRLTTILFVVLALFLSVAGSTAVYAQSAGNNNPQGQAAGNNGTTNTDGVLINPLQGQTLEGFLGGILDFIIRIGTIVIILMMVYVGFKFVAARGNENELVEARRMLLWTVIGALVLLGAKAIAIGICETAKALSTAGSPVSCIF